MTSTNLRVVKIELVETNAFCLRGAISQWNALRGAPTTKVIGQPIALDLFQTRHLKVITG